MASSSPCPGSSGRTSRRCRWQAWVNCGSALVAMVLLANLVRSRIGRSWRAVRDDEVAAALAGINVARMQILAFIVSAAYAGLGGVLLAVVVGTVSPSLFTLSLSIQLLTAAVLGGLGSLSGAIWGSILLVIVPVYLDQLATSHGLTQSTSSSIPILAYGVVLILVMLAFPRGIAGGISRLIGQAPQPDTESPAAALTSWRRRYQRQTARRKEEHDQIASGEDGGHRRTRRPEPGGGRLQLIEQQRRRQVGRRWRRQDPAHRVRARRHHLDDHDRLPPAAHRYRRSWLRRDLTGVERVLPVRQRAWRHLRPEDRLQVPERPVQPVDYLDGRASADPAGQRLRDLQRPRHPHPPGRGPVHQQREGPRRLRGLWL